MRQSKVACTRSALQRFAWPITSKKLIVRKMNSDYFCQQHYRTGLRNGAVLCLLGGEAGIVCASYIHFYA